MKRKNGYLSGEVKLPIMLYTHESDIVDFDY